MPRPPVSVVSTPLNSADSGSNGPETVHYYTKAGAMSRRIHMLMGPRLDRMGEVSAMSVSQEVKELLSVSGSLYIIPTTLSNAVGGIDSTIIGNGSRGNFILMIEN
jgi:hypothetical protein